MSEHPSELLGWYDHACNQYLRTANTWCEIFKFPTHTGARMVGGPTPHNIVVVQEQQCSTRWSAALFTLCLFRSIPYSA